MTEPARGADVAPGEPPPPGASAGALLRAAREHSGMNVEALAAVVKAAPAKIAALEADRFGDLPDLTFARGLARNVCHVLGTDPAPVLALMPPLPSLGPRLEHLHAGLRTTLGRHAGDGAASSRPTLRRPALWMTLLLLLAALAIFLMPQDRAGREDAAGTAPGTVAEEVGAVAPAAVDAGATSAAAAAPAAPPAAPSSAAAAAASRNAGAASPSSAPAGAPLVRVHTDEEAWVEVRDAGGRTLVQRLLRAGETVDIAEATPPLRVKIGNASAVRLDFRGRPVDLATSTRSDVARLELK